MKLNNTIYLVKKIYNKNTCEKVLFSLRKKEKYLTENLNYKFEKNYYINLDKNDLIKIIKEDKFKNQSFQTCSYEDMKGFIYFFCVFFLTTLFLIKDYKIVTRQETSGINLYGFYSKLKYLFFTKSLEIFPILFASRISDALACYFICSSKYKLVKTCTKFEIFYYVSKNSARSYEFFYIQ